MPELDSFTKEMFDVKTGIYFSWVDMLKEGDQGDPHELSASIMAEIFANLIAIDPGIKIEKILLGWEKDSPFSLPSILFKSNVEDIFSRFLNRLPKITKDDFINNAMGANMMKRISTLEFRGGPTGKYKTFRWQDSKLYIVEGWDV